MNKICVIDLNTKSITNWTRLLKSFKEFRHALMVNGETER